MEVCSSTEMGAPGASHLGTGDGGFKTDRSTTISPGKRASVDGSGRLPAGRQTESYSAKSGYNKGTIRSDIRYLVVSKDVRRHRLISVTAEVASSSLVVPAIPIQALTPVEEFSRGHKRYKFRARRQIPRTDAL
jgi:hypothetical protein